jgi:hypothetical protein
MVLLTWFYHYNGVICIAALLYWWNRGSSTNSIGANAWEKNGKSVSILIRFGAAVLAAPIMYRVVHLRK